MEFDLGKFIEERGLKQKDIVDVLNVSKSAVSNVVTGKEKIPKDWPSVLLAHDFSEKEPVSKIGYSKIQQLNLKPKPFYDYEVYGTFDSVISHLLIDARPTAMYNIPYLNGCDCYVRLSGDSMYPKYSHGDIIALKRIYDLEDFVLNEVYMVVTTGDHQNTTKYVQQCPKKPNNWLLVPYNKQAGEPQSIPKIKILEVWRVLGRITL